jgi:hypothetical protein
MTTGMGRPVRSRGVIERANQADPAPVPEPAPADSGAGARSELGRAGVVYALAGILIVVGWLVLCMYLRKVF